MTGTENRIVGAMASLAVGDALGAPVENLTRGEVALRFPGGLRDYASPHGAVRAVGEVTDDTEMAFVVADSLLAQGGLDMDDLAGRLTAWFQTTSCTLGPSTSQALRALSDGIHWSRSGSPAEPSSGVLPRCAPLGLVISRENMVGATTECARATHSHPLAVAVAVLQNLLVQALIGGESWEAALAQALHDTRGIDGAEEVCDSIRSSSGRDGAVAVMAEAVACVGEASSLENALIAAVSAGGDTDTRGAVAGLLAGARWGRQQLPDRWIDQCSAVQQAMLRGSRLAAMSSAAS